MNLLEESLKNIKTIFFDSAPIIYYIESHPKFSNPVRKIVNAFQEDKFKAFSSVLTITEVLTKPVELGKDELAKQFLKFLKYGKNFSLVDINEKIAEKAGRLRGTYNFLKTLDALQLATAIHLKNDIFLSNDKKLKKIKEIKVLILSDYIPI